jgi:hypothetical protein
LAGRGLNPLRGDLPMPVALLKRAALDNNLSVMQAYEVWPWPSSRGPCPTSNCTASRAMKG